MRVFKRSWSQAACFSFARSLVVKTRHFIIRFRVCILRALAMRRQDVVDATIYDMGS